MMRHLIEQIIAICAQSQGDEARKRLASLFDQEQMAAILAPAIKVGPKPAGQAITPSRPSSAASSTEFRPIGTGKQLGTGKAYTLFELLDGTIIGRPHKDGRPLTDEEISDTLKQWNREAAEIVRASHS